MPTPAQIESRNVLQQKAFNTVYHSRRLLLVWGTGVGKSRVGYRLIEQLYREGRRNILLLVAETPHKQNWRNEFIGANPTDGAAIFDQLTVECYASLQKYTNTRWDAIVADEAHHLRSDLRQDILTSLQADWFLALSATISDKGDGESLLSTLNMTFGVFENLKYGLEDAISDGLLPEPIIDVRKVELSANSQERYDKLNEYVDKCKEEYYSLRQAEGLYSEDPENNQTQEAKDKWMHAGSLRKQYLGTLKTWEAKKLLTKLFRQKKRVICFCATIKQIEKLGGENIINSKKTKKQNEETIAAFNEHKIDSLFVVGMLQEGQNLKDIDAGLIVQLDGKERSFIQRFGRVMRSEHPYLYILYIAGTRDEEYLNNALCDRNPDFIKGWEMTKQDQEDQQMTQQPLQGNLFQQVASPPQQVFITPQQVNMIPIKEISYSSLQGPWLNQREIENKYSILHCLPYQGNFCLYANQRFICNKNTVEGEFYGISVNPLLEKTYIFLKDNFCLNSLIQVEADWREIIPTLMQIANLPNLYHQKLKMASILEPYGNWTRIEVQLNGYLPQWIGNQIPESGNEGHNPRLNFANNIIGYIHEKFREQKFKYNSKQIQSSYARQ